MLPVAFFASICLASAAPGPSLLSYGPDEIEGIYYESVDYEENPLLALFHMAAMGPLLSVVGVSSSTKDYTDLEDKVTDKQLEDAKDLLEDVIGHLHKLYSKLDEGKTDVFDDIHGAIQDLKKVERFLNPDLTTHKSKPSIRRFISTTAAPEELKFKTDGKMFFPTKAPISIDGFRDFEDKTSHGEEKIETPFADFILMKESKEIQTSNE